MKLWLIVRGVVCMMIKNTLTRPIRCEYKVLKDILDRIRK